MLKLSAIVLMVIALPFAVLANGGSEQDDGTVVDGVEEIHFLIPGGAGGGWDSTARGVGEVLVESEMLEQASYENMSGGGGGIAIAHLIKTRNSNLAKKTLMVNSTPIVTRSLSKVFPQSFRDLTPVAAVIADYGAFVVREDSDLRNWKQAVDMFMDNPESVKIAGGSAVGSLDHIVAAWAFQEAGGDPGQVVYIPYDAGGKAMAALLAGETALLSTGLGEALQLVDSGQVRILAVTSPERIADAPDVATLVEQGYNVDFANWRGFFAPPDTPDAMVSAYAKLFEEMYDTPEWEEMRKKYGWVNLYKPSDEFVAFLEKQEEIIGGLMRNLGFIE